MLRKPGLAVLTRKLSTVPRSTEDLLERECLFFDERCPHRENVWVIDGEYVNRDSSDRCSTSQGSSRPLEVLVPLVRAGMEKPDEFSGVWIFSRKVRAFVPITVKTGEGEVL
jgi:hypothetical protein